MSNKSEYNKKHYQENKEYYKEYHKKYQKKYYVENKDKLKEMNKKYREDNKDKLKEYNKKYREDNKDKLKESIKCNVCNSIVFKKNLKRHQQTKKCKDNKFIEELMNDIISLNIEEIN